METEDAIQIAIDKATAAGGESEYYNKCMQAAEFASDEAMLREVTSRKEAADAEVTFQQNLKIALVAML